jgi:RimJ/RimL family protein N-acetyltransferase
MAETQFRWLQPPYLLMPYVEAPGLFSPENLVSIYTRLHDEGLWDIVFHDNPDMNLRGFMNFFGSPGVLMQVINIVDGDGIKDMAAIAWLANVERYKDRQRAMASFCVFKDYQSPSVTSPMSKLILDYWFGALRMDIIMGLTPADNHLAVRFSKRIGFQELCRIPKYSVYQGEYTDCVESIIDTARYAELYGGDHGIR